MAHIVTEESWLETAATWHERRKGGYKPPDYVVYCGAKVTTGELLEFPDLIIPNLEYAEPRLCQACWDLIPMTTILKYTSI